MKTTKNRVVIIGLDGVPCHLIRNLSAKGVMPETRRLIERGILLQMESSIPEVSSVAWSTIITGKNPGEHGIFGHTDIPPGTYRLSFPNFNNLKAPPFWQKRPEAKSIIVNVPSTFPVKPLNGVHISGFVSLDLERAVYPPSVIPTLKQLDYRIDVDSSKARVSIDLFLRDLDRTLRARIDAYRYLWKEDGWDTFMLVFTGTDRLSHFLWDAYEKTNHRYHWFFLEHFRRIDEAVGEIAHRLSGNDSLILLSDHGFELLEAEINVNFLLRKTGFLTSRPGGETNFTDIDFTTKAFALDPGRIYIHSKGKYPRGSVDETDCDTLLCELTHIFENLECNGRKAIRGIYRKEQIYAGPYAGRAPDLILIPNRRFGLKADMRANRLFENSVFTGKHTFHDAFLLLHGDFAERAVSETPSVHDVYQVIDAMRGDG